MIHSMIVRAAIEEDVAGEDVVDITAEFYSKKLEAYGCMRSENATKSAGEPNDKEMEDSYDEIT